MIIVNALFKDAHLWAVKPCFLMRHLPTDYQNHTLFWQSTFIMQASNTV